MLEALGDALTAIAHDKSVRAVVLTANGPAFLPPATISGAELSRFGAPMKTADARISYCT